MFAVAKPIVAELSRRERLWIDAGKKCHWCHRETRLCNSPDRDQVTIDHVIPRCRGGSDTLDNVVSACLECNQGRNRADMNQPGHPGYVSARSAKAKASAGAMRSMLLAQNQRDEALRELRALRSSLKELNDRLDRRENYWKSLSITGFIRLKLAALLEVKA